MVWATPSDSARHTGVLPSRIHRAIREHLTHYSDDGNPFFVGDPEFIRQQLDRWKKQLPFIDPFFAVKCNNNREFLEAVRKAGINFDCASKEEISQVLDLGVRPEQVIFASPRKTESHITYAKSQGILKTVIDSEDELYKVKELFPTAQVFVRLWADDPSSHVRLCDKFGLHVGEAKRLLRLASKLEINITGLCFHIGSGASDPEAYNQAIRLTREIYNYNDILERKHCITMIDIGGGFTNANFDKIAPAIRAAAERYFGSEPGIQWMAEPGRFFSSDAFYLVCRVIGSSTNRKYSAETDKPKGKLFVNDGLYQNFLNVLIEKITPAPIPLTSRGSFIVEGQDQAYAIWGQTCCGIDRISCDTRLPGVVQRGDWLCYSSMGAYTNVTASSFNGFVSNTEVIWATKL